MTRGSPSDTLLLTPCVRRCLHRCIQVLLAHAFEPDERAHSCARQPGMLSPPPIPPATPLCLPFSSSRSGTISHPCTTPTRTTCATTSRARPVSTCATRSCRRSSSSRDTPPPLSESECKRSLGKNLALTLTLTLTLTRAVCRSHLGARSEANLPINRGFDSHLGFLKGGEDHWTQGSGRYDLPNSR